MQNILAQYKTKSNGYSEGEKTEYHAFVFIFFKLCHIQLKAGKKHDVEQARFAKQINASFGNNIKPMIANSHTSDYEANDTWNAQLAKKDRSQ